MKYLFFLIVSCWLGSHDTSSQNPPITTDDPLITFFDKFNDEVLTLLNGNIILQFSALKEPCNAPSGKICADCIVDSEAIFLLEDLGNGSGFAIHFRTEEAGVKTSILSTFQFFKVGSVVYSDMFYTQNMCSRGRLVKNIFIEKPNETPTKLTLLDLVSMRGRLDDFLKDVSNVSMVAIPRCN